MSTSSAVNSLPAPGILAPVDYSPEPNAKLSEPAQSALKTLCEKAAKRDMAARRWEVEQTWKARMFERGYQYLLQQRGGGWITAQAKYPDRWAGSPSLDTNIYTPYESILISALTRDTPEVRFDPADPENDADITAADAADNYKKAFARNNDLLVLQTNMVRYLCTDGRAHVYTRFVKDAQRFGYEEDEQPVVPEDETYNGRDDRQVGAPDNSPDVEANGGEPEGSAALVQSGPLGEPRGEEVSDVFGKLEVKVPILTKNQSQWHFLQLSTEHDIAIAKASFPDIADKITPSSGPGENELDRLARINVGLALGSSYIAGDSIVNDVTIQRTWFRPAAFMEISDENGTRAELMQAFPKGCLVVHAGKEFAFARPESMDDHWSLVKASPSDGMNCAGMMSWMISVQERVNNWVDLMDQFFTKTVPARYLDSTAFNIEAIQKQGNAPGLTIPFKRQQGVPFAELKGTDDPITHQPELPAFIEKFINELAQLLTGAYPALSGGDTEGNDTASGIAIQRNQALGRLGLVWHSIQSCTAEYHRQAVQCAAKCREKNIKQAVSESDTVILELNDLKGNVLCYPESDTSFPESWEQRQQRFTALLQDAKNPFIQKLLSLAGNMRMAKDAVGLQEFEIPEADSVDKQRGEFEVLLKTGPVPNPQKVKAEQLLQSAQLKGAPPAALQQLQQQIDQLPDMVSTVPVDPIVDRGPSGNGHQAEAETCFGFLISPQGRKLKNGTPEEKSGYDNIRTHGIEHLTIAQQDQADAAKSAQKQKVAEQISFKDAAGHPEMQAGMAEQAGLPFNAQAQPQEAVQ